MENKKITPPEGYKFEVISETEIKLVPVKQKYPTDISEIERHWNFYRDNKYNVFKFDIHKDNHHSSKETAEKFAAMMQLIEFRDAWNKIDGFVADWKNVEQYKWCIYKQANQIIIDYFFQGSRVLHFSNNETAQLFLETFKELIIKAGDLI